MISAVEQLVALCSCFVFGEKAKDDAGAGLEEALLTPFRMLQDVARRVAKLKIDSKLACDETEYSLIPPSPSIYHGCP